MVRVKLKPRLIRLAIVECVSPLDAMEGRSELAVVGGMAKLVGHAVWGTGVLSALSFREACDYVGSMCHFEDNAMAPPLCLHISAHGYAGKTSSGLSFGKDYVPWSALLEAIQPVLTVHYNGPRVLVFSACDADQQRLTKEIASKAKSGGLLPPQFVFCSTGKVAWDDAALAWTMLYHRMTDRLLQDRSEVQGVLDAIRKVGASSIVYWRWDQKRRCYMKYAGK